MDIPPLETAAPDDADMASSKLTAALTRSSVSEAAARAAPAVVHLVTNSDRGASMFNGGRHSGSGVIYDACGYILTNAHVVVGALDSAAGLTVTLQDGRMFEGRVLGLDRPSDLAVVKIDSEDALPSARLGSSAALRVGEWVVALGSPLLLKHTVTAGIISCVERKGSELGLLSAKTDYIQTDAAVNQGNSGGPLINLDGEVIGINNMKAVAADGVSFAIPIDAAKDIVAQLANKGRVVRPHVGATLADINGGRMRQLQAQSPGFPRAPRGIVVTRVAPGGPAAAAGLQADDVIIGFGAVDDDVTISRLAEALKAHLGGNLSLRVARRGADGAYTTVGVTVQPVEAPT